MTEEERHARLQEAQDKAYHHANKAEASNSRLGDPDYDASVRLANMWANVARSLRKDRV